MGSRTDVPFALKIAIFVTRDPQNPKPPKFAQFWSGLPKFSLDFASMGVTGVNAPYSSSEPNKSVIVNRQHVRGELKYLPKFWIWGTGHVISCMRNDDLHWTGVWSRISRKRLPIEIRLQWSTYRKWYMGYQMGTCPMTSRDRKRSRS